MVTISEAQIQLARQRQTLQERQTQVSESQKRLQSARQSLPELTQSRLREGSLAGLKGIQRRKAIEQAKKTISERQALVGGYGEQLGEFEGKLSESESQIKKFEYRRKRALKQALKDYRLRKSIAEEIRYGGGYLGGIEAHRLPSGYVPPEQLMSYAPSEQLMSYAPLKQIPELLPPPTMVSLPPTLGKQYATAIQEKGIGTGIVSVTFGKVQSIAEQIALGRAGRFVDVPILGTQEPYQPTATGKLFGEVVPMVPYFTPAAAPLLLAGGAESLISPAGKRERELIATYAQERYKVPEKLAKEISFIPAVAEVGLGYLGLRGAKFPELPKKIITPTRPLDIVSKGVEVQRPIFIGDKPSVISKYRITREIAPPKEVLEIGKVKGPEYEFISSRGIYKPAPEIIESRKGLLGADDIFKIKPAKYEVTETPGLVFGEEPFATLTRRGGKVTRIEQVAGESFKVVPTSATEFEKLSKTQKFVWQRLAEDITGRPVALKNVPKILSKNKQFVQSYVETYKLGRIDVSKKPAEVHLLEPRTLGRRIRRAEAGTEFFKRVETPEYEVYEATTFFKDVTKPGARAIGETPKMKIELLKVKEPLYIRKGEQVVDIFQPSTIKKTPLKDTFGIQKLKQEVVLTPKPFIKTPKPKGKPKAKLEIKPEGVSYLGFPTATGRVTFEETFERVPPAFEFRQPSAFYQPSKIDYLPFIKEKPRQIPSVIPIQIPISKVRVAEKVILKQLEVSKQIPRQVSLLALKQVPVLKQIPRQAQRPIQVTRPFLKQEPISRPAIYGRPSPRPKPPKEPRKKPPVAIPFRGKPRKLLKKKEVKGKIIPEIRRRGLWIPLGKVKTEKEALARAKRKVLGTLAASLRLRRAGTGELIEIKNGSRFFRPSKRERKVLVQRRLMRLMAPGERREIISARRGKIKWIK